MALRRTDTPAVVDLERGPAPRGSVAHDAARETVNVLEGLTGIDLDGDGTIGAVIDRFKF